MIRQTTLPRARAPVPVVRCAVYTRKSTEDGLEQQYNSLHAQRDACEAYIQSQASTGWTCLPDEYDDGGYSGGNTERPALQRLLADIEAGRIDAVVVYKVDRLSRSLLDFARLIEVFERRQVSFVSVTQQFSTGTSTGRLVMNVLLSFAQFERELISERTRDKIAATRRKGRWCGGRPVLGYDLDARSRRLIINPAEAQQVREIFQLYLDHGGLVPTVQELNRRGWTTKAWTTQGGRNQGRVNPGKSFGKGTLHQLLTNVLYIGQVKYKDEVHPGEQPAIVDPELFAAVQASLVRNRVAGAEVRHRHGALLRGLLRCTACNCAMSHSYTTKRGRRYRYYVCNLAQKAGRATCPVKSIPADEIERYVVDQIRSIGRDPTVVAETLNQAQAEVAAGMKRTDGELAAVRRELARHQTDLAALAAAPVDDRSAARLADLHERVQVNEGRRAALAAERADLERQLVDEADVRAALAEFDPVWSALTPREQACLLNLLVAEVAYDGRRGSVALTFHPSGIKTLVAEAARHAS